MSYSTNRGRRLRLLHIAELYPPGYAGGAAVYVQDVCRFLAQRGHKVQVFTAEQAEGEPYALRTENDGAVQVIRVNLPYIVGTDPEGWGLGLKGWRAHQRRLVAIIGKILEEEKPDLVHCHLARLLGEEFIIDIERRGIPLVWMLHDYWPICLRMQYIRSPLDVPCSGPTLLRCFECIYSNFDGSHWRALLKLPWRLLKLGPLPAYKIWRRSLAHRCGRGTIGYSEHICRTHRSYLPEPIQHIRLGIDLTNRPRQIPVRPHNPFRFGFVAGFQPHKGIWHVLDAAASLKRRGFQFELHVWGPGQEKGLAEIQARGLEDRVFLHGIYPANELWEVYSNIDIAIMATTVHEPFGRVVKEAAAVGVPTIAPDAGGLSEQIRHGVDGLLYRFRDPLDLERQMARVLEEPNLLHTLASNLLPVPDTRESVAEVEQFYFKVLGLST